VKPRTALAAALALAGGPAAYAIEAGEHVDATLSLRTDAWTGTRRLDDEGAVERVSGWGRAKVDLQGAGTLVGDGWVGAQSGGEHPRRSRVRELYWRSSHGRVDWKLGRQKIVWGRADALNPTDNLSPRDFILLVPEDDEQRRGNDGAQVAVDLGFGVLSGVWFPQAASHTLPLEPLPQVSYDIAKPPRRSQTAIKLDMTGDGIDGSISYFHGTDLVPDLSIGGVGPAGLQVAVRNNPLRVLGADVSLTRGGTVWRAEAAWMDTDSAGPDDFVRKKPRVWLVGGGEWQLAGTTTFGVQASVQHVMHFRSPDTLASPIEREVAWRQAALSNQTSANQLGMTFRLATRLLNDTLTAETSGAVMGSPRSGLWRTRFTYAVNDRLKLHAGTDLTFGPTHSLWGQFRKNRLAFVQLRYGF
jgi:hypothetical protein